MKAHEKRILASIIMKIIVGITAFVFMFLPIIKSSTPEELGIPCSVSVSVFDLMIGNVNKTVEMETGIVDIPMGEANFYDAQFNNDGIGIVVSASLIVLFVAMAIAAVVTPFSSRKVLAKKGLSPKAVNYFIKYIETPAMYVFSALCLILSIGGILLLNLAMGRDSINEINWIFLLCVLGGFFVALRIANAPIMKYIKDRAGFEKKYGCRPLFSGLKEKKQDSPKE